MFAVRAAGNTTIAHSGGLDGFNTYMAYDPVRRTTVIVLGNLNGPAPDSLGASLLGLAREESSLRQADGPAAAAVEPLQTFVGVYDLTPTSSVIVSLVNGRLRSQITGEKEVELDPGSGDVFSLRASDVRLTFTRDASGAVSGLILHRDGRDAVARKT